MRLPALILSVVSCPALAWEFTPVPVCTLETGGPTPVVVTYDQRRAEPYAITVFADAPWPPGDVFALAFAGGQGFTITTRRHALSDDGRELTVTDRGFGNVLDGLERNTSATATLGGAARTISLDGAAGAVRAFRACTVAPVA